VYLNAPWQKHCMWQETSALWTHDHGIVKVALLLSQQLLLQRAMPQPPFSAGCVCVVVVGGCLLLVLLLWLEKQEKLLPDWSPVNALRLTASAGSNAPAPALLKCRGQFLLAPAWQ
jgi:hypothetical protein